MKKLENLVYVRVGLMESARVAHLHWTRGGTSLARQSAWYRMHGKPAESRKWAKNWQKNTGPRPEMGTKCPKNGEKMEKWAQVPFLDLFGAIHFWNILCLFPAVGQRPIFHLFSILYQTRPTNASPSTFDTLRPTHPLLCYFSNATSRDQQPQKYFSHAFCILYLCLFFCLFASFTFVYFLVVFVAPSKVMRGACP